MTRLLADLNPHRHRYSPDWPLAGMASRGESAREHRECIAVFRDECRALRLMDEIPRVAGEPISTETIEGPINFAPHGAPLALYR